MSTLARKSMFLGIALTCVSLMSGAPVRAELVPRSTDQKLRLEDIVARAIQNAQILGAQDARVEEKRLAASQARTWSGASFDFSTGRKKAGALSGPRSEWNFSQPLPLLGKPGLQGGLLDLESESWRIRREATRLGVTIDVVRLVYEYAVNQRKTAFAEKRQKRFDLIREYLAGRPFSTPQRKAESRIVENKLSRLAADAMQNQIGARSSLEKLRAFVPLEHGTLLRVEVPWLSGSKALDEKEWVSKALQGSPELLLQRLTVKGADVEKTLISKERWPDPALTASIEESKTLETEKDYGLGISLALPPWNGNRTGVKSAERRKVAEEEFLAHEEKRLKADVSRLIVEYEGSRQIVLGYPESTLQEYEKQIQEAEAGFRKGQLDLLTFLELDDSASEAFTRVLDAQFGLASRAAELMAVAGESDPLPKLNSF